MRTGSTASAGPSAVEAKSVWVRVGEKDLLRDVSLDVKSASAHALVGANGSGKTTILKTLVGLYRPSSGEISLWGSQSPSEFRRSRRRTALCLGGDRGLYPKLTALENGLYYASLYGRSPRMVTATLRKLLDDFDLPLDQPVEFFSRGMKQKLHLARAASVKPDLLILDEPTSNLDDSGAKSARGVIADMIDKGCAVIVATHEIGDIEAWDADVHAIFDGRIVRSLSFSDLDARRGRTVLELSFASEEEGAAYELAVRQRRVIRNGRTVLVTPAPDGIDPTVPGREAVIRPWTLDDLLEGLD